MIPTPNEPARPSMLSIVEGPLDFNDSRRILLMKGRPQAVARRNSFTKVAAIVLGAASLLCVVALGRAVFDGHGSGESSAMAATTAPPTSSLHAREPGTSRSLTTQPRALAEVHKKAAPVHAKRGPRKGWGARGA
ncbi:MAG: hypothetical protein U0169_16700 [Polyangiaceae bacterium]